MKHTHIALAGILLLICILLTAGCIQQTAPTQTDVQKTVQTQAQPLTTAAPIVSTTVVPAEPATATTTAASVVPSASISKKVTFTDGFGRTVTGTTPSQKVVCSGAGCLRYLTYLQAQDKAVGVDSIEKEVNPNDARGYALANPQFSKLPLIGEYRGKDDPEKIIAIAPEIVFKTGMTGQPSATSKTAVDELQRKTKITVIGFNYGGLRTKTEKADMYNALTIMGNVMGKEARAKEVTAYIDAAIEDLNKRTRDIPDSSQKTAYIGGVALSGPHGFVSTEPAYPPFLWVNAKNAATQFGTEHADIAKEYITAKDPEYIFVDLSTIQDTSGGSAIDQLKKDPAYQKLSAVKNGKVYGVLPYNWYATNYENVLADAYFVGKVLYPEQFADIDPVQKANEITTFFDGKPMMDTYQTNFNGLVFKQLPF